MIKEILSGGLLNLGSEDVVVCNCGCGCGTWPSDYKAGLKNGTADSTSTAQT